MNAIQKAIEVLQGCLEHPGADDAIAGLQAMLAQEPVAYLICGGRWGDELEEWEIDPVQSECDKINDAAYEKGKKLKVPLFAGHTAQREPLTDDFIISAWRCSAIFGSNHEKAIGLARAIEAAHCITKDTP
jgi:hypothetical protein